MRKYIVAGNWKMNTTVKEGIQLAKEIKENLGNTKVQAILCPPSTHLYSVQDTISGSDIAVGAQNCYHQPKGAFTGEISTNMLTDLGIKTVILGHSERRSIFGESSKELKDKVDACIQGNMHILFCIGESLEERENEDFFQILLNQLQESVFHLNETDFKHITLAYEPVWAIGTGKTASPEQAEEVHAFLRKEVAKQYSEEVAENTTILYGGSCKPNNANDIFAQPNVDGGLIGGAALKSSDFLELISALDQQKK
jgi:triosephosphate isomerase